MFNGKTYGEWIHEHTRSDMTELERRIVLYEAEYLVNAHLGDAKAFVTKLDYYVTHRNRLG